MGRRAFLILPGVMAATVALAIGGGLRDDLTADDLRRVLAVTEPAAEFDEPEPFERMQAGAASSTERINANAFSHASANLAFEDLQRFLLGNGLFRKDWVSSPSSTLASDGLGPLFNARACQSCHFKDGRGHAPSGPDQSALSMLVRLSAPPSDAQARDIADGRLLAAPEPTYGHQLQDFGVAGLAPEGKVSVRYEDVPVTLGDGEVVTLRRPELSIGRLGYGAMAPGTMMSARVAQPMIGLGLLEAIHEADILARQDAEDMNGDGISGRANWTRDQNDTLRLGRFGWKAIEPSVARQSAHAFFADMGLSTPVAQSHFGDCTEAQRACRIAPDGAQPHLGAEEVPGNLLDLVSFYASNLAVPARRGESEAEVLAGKRLFYETGCPACHTPKFVTRRDAAHDAQSFQLVWPYTDLLLHDMGEGLADHRPEGLASGSEWRTPPLWGIGLTKTVNGQASFLHDGRARTVLEAILWHGGEAEPARTRVVAMERAEREALLRFLESL